MTQIKMRKFAQNKLWRDKANDILEKEHGSVIHWRPLDDHEFNEQLRLKLLEEADEVRSAKSKEDLIGELADVFEVLDNLCKLNNISKDEIIAMQAIKVAKRGGFAERKYVTSAEHTENSFGAKYCLADPVKYPEIIDQKEACQAVNRMTWTEEEYNVYAKAIIATDDAQGKIDFARKEGIAEGEIKSKKEAATNLLKLGKLSIEDIAQVIGLTIDEVEQLKK